MKKILIGLFSCLMIIILTACSKNEGDLISELEGVNSTISQYMAIQKYENFVFNYVDYENKVVIVGMENISKEEQKKFKKTVLDSKLIEFVQADKLEDLPSIDDENLSNLQTNIINSISILEYNNAGAIYINQQDYKVVVELIDNSEEQQIWFKENINDSNLIVFEQG